MTCGKTQPNYGVRNDPLGFVSKTIFLRYLTEIDKQNYKMFMMSRYREPCQTRHRAWNIKRRNNPICS